MIALLLAVESLSSLVPLVLLGHPVPTALFGTAVTGKAAAVMIAKGLLLIAAAFVAGRRQRLGWWMLLAAALCTFGSTLLSTVLIDTTRLLDLFGLSGELEASLDRPATKVVAVAVDAARFVTALVALAWLYPRFCVHVEGTSTTT